MVASPRASTRPRSTRAPAPAQPRRPIEVSPLSKFGGDHRGIARVGFVANGVERPGTSRIAKFGGDDRVRTRRIDFALFMVEALTNPALVREAPAIVGCQTPSALAHAAARDAGHAATPA